jgi:hypothetical protein
MKLPANSQLPVLLVDVDGVISLFGFHMDKRPAGAFLSVDGIPHYLSSTAGEHLRALSEHFELIWCTGWRSGPTSTWSITYPYPLCCIT